MCRSEKEKTFSMGRRLVGGGRRLKLEYDSYGRNEGVYKGVQ